MLLKQKPNPTKTDAAQLERWNLFLIGWKKAARNKFCILIGDVNLDFCRWHNPEPAHIKWYRGRNVQIIQGITRTWRNTTDSLVDHIWMDKPNRIISHQNELRASSDHNVISVIVRTKDRCYAAQEMKGRCWKKFSQVIFREKISTIDWTPLFLSDNLDVKNTIFEEEIGKILEKMAPMKYNQVRKIFRNWVDDKSKNLMEKRDLLREKAKQTDDQG